MTETVRETERKYEARGAGPALPPLDGVPGVARVADGGTATLDALYYDTPDLRLAAHGTTLRRRTGGADPGWHLKLPLAPHVQGNRDTREEVRLPLAAGDAVPPDAPPEVPPELAALVRARTGDRPLRPAARLVTVRDLHLLLDAEGRTLAEVARDRVAAHRLTADAPEAAVTQWSEVEVELGPQGDGGTALLDAVEQRLAAAGLRRSAAASKLARALGPDLPAAPAPPPLRTGRATAADAVLAHLAGHTERLTALDAAVRRDLPDSVHRMRIAARRLRSALKTFAGVLDPAATGPLADELRWLGAELGADRDREVLDARLRGRVAALPAPLVVGPVPARLELWSVRRAADTRPRVLAALDSPRCAALYDALEALLADPPPGPDAGRPAARVLPAALRRDWRRLAKRVGPALAAPPGPGRDRLLHEARKAAKRARYAAEAAQPVLGRPAKRFRDRMKELQELLGEHQDAVVARTVLRELAAAADAAGEPSFTWGVLHQVEQDAADAAERRLPRAWRRASRPGLRRRLSR
ncbi:CHAD domain-containing protein [Streptomyces sp. NPDC001380]|uniref:CYTH and CHAD domain-containing protein n=1 Tax=Streptomyces sp. NPDC001380 TaxID=3364566 RepID=UPI0036C315FB